MGGIRGRFPPPERVADLARRRGIPGQLARGYTSICFKPSMFTDDPARVGPLCRDLVARVAAL